MGCGASVRQDVYLEEAKSAHPSADYEDYGQANSTWADPVNVEPFSLGGEWRFEESPDVWRSLDSEVNAQLLVAYYCGDTQAVYNFENQQFEVDFSTCIQTNLKTGERQRIGWAGESPQDEADRESQQASYPEGSVWVDYQGNPDELLNAWAHGYTYVYYAAEGYNFQLDFSRMVETNLDTGEERPLGWEVVDDDDDNEGHQSGTDANMSGRASDKSMPDRVPQTYAQVSGRKEDLNGPPTTSEATTAAPVEELPSDPPSDLPEAFAQAERARQAHQKVAMSAQSCSAAQAEGPASPSRSSQTYSLKGGAGMKEDFRGAAGQQQQQRGSNSSNGSGAGRQQQQRQQQQQQQQKQRQQQQQQQQSQVPPSKKFSLGPNQKSKPANNSTGPGPDRYQTTANEIPPTWKPHQNMYTEPSFGQHAGGNVRGAPHQEGPTGNYRSAAEHGPSSQAPRHQNGGNNDGFDSTQQQQGARQQGRPLPKAKAKAAHRRPNLPQKKWTLGPEKRAQPPPKHFAGAAYSQQPGSQPGAPNAGGGAGGGGAPQAPGLPPKRQGSFEMPPGVKLPENPQAKRVVENLVRDMQKSKAQPMAKRRQAYKVACLSWHPDKNPKHVALATEIFQVLQDLKPWYLGE